MPRLRLLATTLSLSLVIAASGCASIEQLFAGPSTGEPLIGTSWSGTDSDDDEWGIVFQDDGTIGLTLNGNEYDDPTDTWVVAEETITISIVFDTGVGTMVGPYTDGATSIDLEGEQGDASWTLTIEQN